MSATPPQDGDDDESGSDDTTSGGSALDRGLYGLSDTVETFGTSDGPTVTVDGTTIEAVTQVTASGEGREKQYLTAVQAGGSGGGEDASDAAEDASDDDSAGEDDSGSGGAGAGSGDDTRTPGLTLTIQCRLGRATFDTLASLREVEEPFDVSISDFSFDSMELVDLQREQTGENARTYNATIEVREYREQTIRLPVGNTNEDDTGDDSSETDSGEEDSEVGDTTEDWVQEGSGGVSEPAGDFDTVEVTSDETIQVGDDETHSNILYDLQGGSVQIQAVGTGWTVKNIGVTGQHPGGNFMIRAAVTAEDANGLIDNVYMGDGQAGGTQGGGIMVMHGTSDQHVGAITIRRANIAQMVDSGIRSGIAAQQDPTNNQITGKIDVQNSRFFSSNRANIRLATSPDRTSYIRNTVSTIQEDAIPAFVDGSIQPRALWLPDGTVEIINSDIAGPIDAHQRAAFSLQDSRRGDDADGSRNPSGVPLNAEAAAGGDA